MIVRIVLYLHCTSNMTIIEVSFPSWLWATHRYPPLSFLFTSVIVRSELFAENLILLLLFTVFLTLYHENCGSGFPVALQVKVTLFLSVSVTFCGCFVTSGRSKMYKQKKLIGRLGIEVVFTTMILYTRLWSKSWPKRFAEILNKCSVQFSQDDGDIMELSNVFYMEKSLSLVVISNSCHLRCAHFQSIYIFNPLTPRSNL